jgi:hypothetical protein
MGPTAIVSKALGKPLDSSGVISTLVDAIHALEVTLVGASASAHWPAAASGSPLKPSAEDAGSLTCAPAER